MRVAYELGRTEQEVLDMSPEEFARWGAFLQMMDDAKRRQ